MHVPNLIWTWETKRSGFFSSKIRQHAYIRKKGLAHKKNKRYNDKSKAKKFIKNIHNSNQEAKMANLGAKQANIH